MIQPSNVDPTTLSQVDMVIISKSLNLLLAEVHVREQSSLCQKMTPRAGRLELVDKEMVQGLSNPDYAITGCLYFFCPFGKQFAILHDGIRKPGSISWC